MESLTHNSATFVPDGTSLLKLRHFNHDRDAFDEVMTAEPPVDHPSLKHADSLLVRAHGFFAEAVAQWLGDPQATAVEARAEQLAAVL